MVHRVASTTEGRSTHTCLHSFPSTPILQGTRLHQGDLGPVSPPRGFHESPHAAQPGWKPLLILPQPWAGRAAAPLPLPRATPGACEPARGRQQCVRAGRSAREGPVFCCARSFQLSLRRRHVSIACWRLRELVQSSLFSIFEASSCWTLASLLIL